MLFNSQKKSFITEMLPIYYLLFLLFQFALAFSLSALQP